MLEGSSHFTDTIYLTDASCLNDNTYLNDTACLSDTTNHIAAENKEPKEVSETHQSYVSTMATGEQSAFQQHAIEIMFESAFSIQNGLETCALANTIESIKRIA